MKELFIRFTARAFCKRLSIYVFGLNIFISTDCTSTEHRHDRNSRISIYVMSYFPFGFEGRMWDLIISVPDHCLSFYFKHVSYIFAFLTLSMLRYL